MHVTTHLVSMTIDPTAPAARRSDLRPEGTEIGCRGPSADAWQPRLHVSPGISAAPRTVIDEQIVSSADGRPSWLEMNVAVGICDACQSPRLNPTSNAARNCRRHHCHGA